MKEDLAYFDRIEDSSDPNKSWKYLQRCLRRQCQRIRSDQNDKALCPPDALAKVAAGIGGDAAKPILGTCEMFLKGKCKFGKDCKLKHNEAMQKQFLDKATTSAMVTQPEPKTKGQDNKGDKSKGKGDKKGKGGGKGKEGKGPNAPDRSKQTYFNKVWFKKCDVKDCPRDHTKKAVDAFRQSPGFAELDKRAQAMLAAGKTTWDSTFKE